jgi:sterol desaturase/sphingolipid hydroxylase (fatty acid hydroxylase superfamily)
VTVDSVLSYTSAEGLHLMLFFVTLLVSLLVASFFGHVVHWALHQRQAGIFYRAHREHHVDLYPPGKLVSDSYRSAKWCHRGPVLFTLPLLVILGAACGLLWLLAAPWWTSVVFSGVLVGYGFFNDYVHDSFHLRRHPWVRFAWFRRARKLHLLHHVNTGSNFGIVSFGWDRAFGTLNDRRYLSDG